MIKSVLCSPFSLVHQRQNGALRSSQTTDKQDEAPFCCLRLAVVIDLLYVSVSVVRRLHEFKNNDLIEGHKCYLPATAHVIPMLLHRPLD